VISLNKSHVQKYGLNTYLDRSLVEPWSNQFFHLSDNVHGLRGHSLKLSFNRSRLDLRKNFFSQRVISAWNSLPQNVVDATSVNSFKNRLDAYW